MEGKDGIIACSNESGSEVLITRSDIKHCFRPADAVDFVELRGDCVARFTKNSSNFSLGTIVNANTDYE